MLTGIYGKLPHGTFHHQHEPMHGEWDSRHIRGPVHEDWTSQAGLTHFQGNADPIQVCKANISRALIRLSPVSGRCTPEIVEICGVSAGHRRGNSSAEFPELIRTIPQCR